MALNILDAGTPLGCVQRKSTTYRQMLKMWTVCRKTDPIVGWCSSLAATEYTRWHDNADKQIYQQLALKDKLKTRYSPNNKHLPQAVLENECTVLYVDRQIITDKKINHDDDDEGLPREPTLMFRTQ